MAVFLVIGGMGLSLVFIGKTGIIQQKGILGGPSLVNSAEGAEVQIPENSSDVPIRSEAFLSSAGAPIALGTTESADSQMPIIYNNGAVEDPGQPIGPAFDRSGTIDYKVQKGDSLSQIAAYFDISVDTIINANPGIKERSLQVGQIITILPTSGVVYQSQTGDTLASISNTFNIPQDKITQFNPSVKFALLDPGTPVIIPGGTAAGLASAGTGGGKLPNFNSQFVVPANGYDWGILHHYNAVDIANSCGTPVVAAADGIVVPDPDISYVSGGWNGGYGNFVLLEHSFGNNVETRYAHLEQVSVQIGDYVKQGQEIGLMGESGEATGCHVHFEVIGAQNPFAK